MCSSDLSIQRVERSGGLIRIINCEVVGGSLLKTEGPSRICMSGNMLTAGPAGSGMRPALDLDRGAYLISRGDRFFGYDIGISAPEGVLDIEGTRIE